MIEAFEDPDNRKLAPRDDDPVPRLVPHRSRERRVPRGESARRALSVDPDVAEARRVVRLGLNEVVADLVDELEVLAEHGAKRRGDLLEDDQPIQDGCGSIAATRSRSFLMV